MAIIKQKILNALLKQDDSGSSIAGSISKSIGSKDGSGFDVGGFVKGIFKSIPALSGGGGSKSGGGLLSTIFNVGKSIFGFHEGGVGDSERTFTRLVNATPKLHSGGIAGLKENERLRVLEEDEGVFTRGQMKAIGAGLSTSNSDKIVVNNMIDSGDFVSKGLNDVKGQKAFFNMITNNKQTIKGILR